MAENDDFNRRDDDFDRRPVASAPPPSGPGVALLIAGLTSFAVAALVLVVFVFMLDKVVDVMKKHEQGLPPGADKDRVQDQIKQIETSREGVQAFYGAVGGAGVVTSGIIILGALGMMRGRGYVLAVAGSVLAVIPVANCCFVIATPIGIWCLITLFNPRVKASFGRPPRRSDGYDDFSQEPR